MNHFPQCERSLSVYEIEALFSKGKHRVEGPLKMVVSRIPRQSTCSEPKVKVLFSVPKRGFKKANKRNLLRRRMKEAYRLQKGFVSDAFDTGQISIAWIYIGKEIVAYQEIYENMSKHLQWLGKYLKKNSDAGDALPHQSV